MTTTALVYPGRPHYDSGTLVLAAGVATILILDVGSARDFNASIANIGATNPIDTIAVALAHSDEASQYQTQTSVGAAFGSTAPGVVRSYDKIDDARRFVKITLTSTIGTSARVQGRSQ